MYGELDVVTSVYSRREQQTAKENGKILPSVRLPTKAQQFPLDFSYELHTI